MPYGTNEVDVKPLKPDPLCGCPKQPRCFTHTHFKFLGRWCDNHLHWAGDLTQFRLRKVLNRIDKFCDETHRAGEPCDGAIHLLTDELRELLDVEELQ
jgi:hypothetical protein